MTDDPVRLLVQEVDDYLEVSAVGLYEFIWILRGNKVEGSFDQLVHYAEQALRVLLENEQNRLVQLAWPDQEPIAELQRESQPHDFDEPTEDAPYVAMARKA